MSARSLRACLVCSIIQPASKFRNIGCPNCEAFLELRGSDEGVQEATSPVFEGMITMANTQDSWVAKWQRVQGLVPGLYAVKVVGLLPEEFIAAVENAGVKYIPRDGSGTADEQ